jgi:hypothetical protein
MTFESILELLHALQACLHVGQHDLASTIAENAGYALRCHDRDDPRYYLLHRHPDRYWIFPSRIVGPREDTGKYDDLI